MKKADLTTPVLLWFTTIVIAVIIVVWFVQSAGINRFDIRSVDEDLKNLRYELSLACTYNSYQSRLPINSKYGTLSINQTQACVIQQAVDSNLTRCLPIPCEVESTEIDLIVPSIQIIKEETVRVQ